ncbi:GNAT family N-acetyltransferase [Planctomonas sp. JC2975]|uniref:GNAT family N-acetyltransferase n=1 Tax=Planctomonas sp. JC2975 TaxID=2729626 RepID=UPI001473716D|nr:GNAT family N-acetyltransferase [Planctomonas sp. JC2975]
MDSAVSIRDAQQDDWPAIWRIIREVAAAQGTFAMDAAPEEHSARSDWMTRAPGRVVVAVADDVVVGTANMYANRRNQGSHVASGSFMVATASRGRGAGRALVRDMIHWAEERGFAGIQFNAVVRTNVSAIRLYTSEGFRIIGSAPGAFEHPEHGRVDLLIMWRDLESSVS